MATTRGCSGAVRVGSNYVAEVKSWSFSESAEVIDTSVINASCNKSFQVGAVQVTGQISCWWDASDTNGQEALDVGATVTLSLCPEGYTTGDIYYTGSALITSREVSGAVDGIVECSFNFQVSGAWTRSVVA